MKSGFLLFILSFCALVMSACGARPPATATPLATPPRWPSTTAPLNRCTTLDMPTRQQAAYDPETRWRYAESSGPTLVMNRWTDEVVATIPVSGQVSFNRCNNRVLIAAGEQGVFIVDGETHQAINHIPYLLEENPPGSSGKDAHTYAIGAVSNSITNDYFILVRRLICAHGGCWRVTNLRVFDGTTLAINNQVPVHLTNTNYNIVDLSNAIYDPVARLFYSTTYCCGDRPHRTVSAWDTNWTEPPVHVLYGIGGGQTRYGPWEYVVDGGRIRLDATKRRLYVRHMRWEIALDADTFRIAGTYPEDPRAMPSVTENVEPEGVFLGIFLSPLYVQDRTLFLLTTTGLYRSTDDGRRWASILLYSFSPSLNNAQTVILSPDYGHDQTLFVYLSSPDPNNSEGLLKTTDGGDTWRPTNNGLPNLNLRSLLISPDYSNDHTLWVSVSDGDVFLERAVWMASTDRGDSWQPIDSTTATPTISSPDISLMICGGTNVLGKVELAIQATEQDGTPIWFVTKRVKYDDRIYSGPSQGCWHEMRMPVTTNMSPGVYSPFIAASSHYATDRTLFVIVHLTNTAAAYITKLYRSTDGGHTWDELLYSQLPPKTAAPEDSVNPNEQVTP